MARRALLVAAPRRARRVDPTEGQIHRAVVAYCRLALRPGAVLHHSPNEGGRTTWEKLELTRKGTRWGWPDLEILADGRAYFLELKPAKGVPDPRQSLCHDDLRAAGAEVAIAHGVEVAIAQLTAWGLTRVHPIAEARARAGLEAA